MALVLTLVHSPLVGPATWDVLAAALSDRGREAWIPDLTRSVSDGPPYLPGQVESIVEVVDGRPTILVGHSGAGPLLAPSKRPYPAACASVRNSSGMLRGP